MYGGDLKSDHPRSRNILDPHFLTMVGFSNFGAIALVIVMVPTFKIWTFLSGFQMILEKMAAFVQISDPIGNQNNLQTNLLLTIQNPD